MYSNIINLLKKYLVIGFNVSASTSIDLIAFRADLLSYVKGLSTNFASAITL